MTPWRKYKIHQYRSKRSGVEFLFTFEEWYKIWIDSGHWHERGCHKGQYVMARYEDKGPYAVGNVKIIKHEENGAERKFKFNEEQKSYLSRVAMGRKISAEARLKISKANSGRKHTTEELQRMRLSNIGKNKGKIHSYETRQKMSKSKMGNRGNPTFFVDYLGNHMSITQAVYASGNIVTVPCAVARIKNYNWSVYDAVEIPPGRKITIINTMLS